MGYFDKTLTKSRLTKDLKSFLEPLGYDVVEHKHYYGIKDRRTNRESGSFNELFMEAQEPAKSNKERILEFINEYEGDKKLYKTGIAESLGIDRRTVIRALKINPEIKEAFIKKNYEIELSRIKSKYKL